MINDNWEADMAYDLYIETHDGVNYLDRNDEEVTTQE